MDKDTKANYNQLYNLEKRDRANASTGKKDKTQKTNTMEKQLARSEPDAWDRLQRKLDSKERRSNAIANLIDLWANEYFTDSEFLAALKKVINK